MEKIYDSCIIYGKTPKSITLLHNGIEGGGLSGRAYKIDFGDLIVKARLCKSEDHAETSEHLIKLINKENVNIPQFLFRHKDVTFYEWIHGTDMKKSETKDYAEQLGVFTRQINDIKVSCNYSIGQLNRDISEYLSLIKQEKVLSEAEQKQLYNILCKTNPGKEKGMVLFDHGWYNFRKKEDNSLWFIDLENIRPFYTSFDLVRPSIAWMDNEELTSFKKGYGDSEYFSDKKIKAFWDLYWPMRKIKAHAKIEDRKDIFLNRVNLVKRLINDYKNL